MHEPDEHERRSGPFDRRSEWQDPRLNDLAEMVRHNDERLDGACNLLAAHDLQLIEAERARRTKSEHNFATYLMLATVVLGQVATIITLILELGGHAVK